MITTQKITKQAKGVLIEKTISMNSETIRWARPKDTCLWNPNLWIELLQSTDHKAIIQAKETLAYGKGLFYDSKGNKEAQEFFENYLEPAAKSLISDQTVFGGHLALLRFRKNTEGIFLRDIIEFYHQHIDEMRIVNYTDYPKLIELRPDWREGKLKDWKIKTYPIINQQPKPTQIDVKNAVRNEGLYYYFKKTCENKIYPLPTYASNVNYLKTAIHHSQFNLKIVENGYFPSVIIQIPEMPEEYNLEYPAEGKVKNPVFVNLIKMIKDFWSGTENAGKALIFGVLPDGRKVEIIQLELSNNVDIFKNQDNLTIQKTMTSNNWTPILAGFSGSGTMSGNAGEIANSLSMAMAGVIYPQIQEPILSTYRNIMKYNGFPIDKENLYFESLIPPHFIFGSDVLLKSTYINELRKMIGLTPIPEGAAIADSAGIRTQTTPLVLSAITEAGFFEVSSNEFFKVYQKM